ncbi:MAG: hypothetical protein ACM3SR_10365 [Ignavibacteriales bacterium]
MNQEKKVEVSKADSSSEFLCIATFLPVRSWFDVILFLRMSLRVERQLKETDGLIRYALRANLLRKQFWTLSVWKGRASANGFVAAEPHATAVGKFQQWVGRGAAFVQWNSSDGTIDWNEALQRLQNPTFYYKGDAVIWNNQPKKCEIEHSLNYERKQKHIDS